MTKVVALLMAAGNARRMGGPNKLLLEFKGRPLIEHTIQSVSKADFDDRLMVTGRDQKILEQFGLKYGFAPVYNPYFEDGFGTSLSAGFSALLKLTDVNGAMVVLGDMPFVSSQDFDLLLGAFKLSGGHKIIRASCDGQAGNPVIVPRALFADLASLSGDQTGQLVLKASGYGFELV
ncbi:MAG: nucleotidyltransferase family protein, partial [Notoacmeibacter sp.]